MVPMNMGKAILFGSWALVIGLVIASAFSHSIYWAGATIFLIGFVNWLQEKLLSRRIDYPTPKEIFEKHPFARPSILVYMALMTVVFLYHFFVAPLAIFDNPTALLFVAMSLGCGIMPMALSQYYAFKGVTEAADSAVESQAHS